MNQYDQTTIELLKIVRERLEVTPIASLDLLGQLQDVIELAEIELDLSDD